MTALSSDNDETVNKESPTVATVPPPISSRTQRHTDLARKAGERIRHAREMAGLSQRELGVRCGLDSGNISRIEKGKKTLLSAALIFDICEALSLDPAYVWWGQIRALRSEPPRLPSPPSAAPMLPDAPSTRPPEAPPKPRKR